MVRGAHDLLRRGQPGPHRPRGDLRPRDVGDPLRRRGGGAAPRERHPLRPGGRGVEPRRVPLLPHGEAPAGGGRGGGPHSADLRRGPLGGPNNERAARRAGAPGRQGRRRGHRALEASGYGLVVFDAARPWSVTKVLWDETPPEKRAFAANPARGSNHNRGCAGALSLYALATGEPVSMPSGYD